MSDTVYVTYVGPFSAVELPVGQIDLLVPSGGTVAVPSTLAGVAPTDDDLGFGLLAQPSNWRLATKAEERTAAKDAGPDALPTGPPTEDAPADA